MAEIKKYLDSVALGTLVDQIKAEDAKALQTAKDYADGLADNYDAAGAAASAQSAAEAKAQELVNAEKQRAEAAEQANATAAANAQAAAEAADAKAVAAQGEVDALETYVGTFTHDTAKSVVEYINAKTDGIATSGNLEALGARVTAVEGDVATIKGDYLKTADKTELEGKITAEAEAARAAEKANADAIKAIQDDYLVEADKTELTGKITAAQSTADTAKAAIDAFLLEADATEKAVDTLKEIQAELAEGEASAASMLAEINALKAVDNATQAELDAAIETLEGADADQVERIEALEAKFGDGEGNVEAQIEAAKQAAIAEAVSQAETKDVTRIAEAKKYTDDEIAELDLANTYAAKEHDHVMADITDLAAELEKYQAKGDYATKTEAQAMADGKDAAIAEAKKAGTDAAAALETYKTSNDARVAAVEGAVATKAEQSALEAAVARITANETAIAANTSAIGSFTAITSAEVEALFA